MITQCLFRKFVNHSVTKVHFFPNKQLSEQQFLLTITPSTSSTITFLLVLCCGQLLLQRFRHLWWWWARQTEVDLYRVVDKPLQSGQCADHDDPREETLPHP